MSWANGHVAKLKAGETVQFRPHGNSMLPKIKSGQLVTVEPIGETAIESGQIVLCKVKGMQYVHLVNGIRDGQYQIGNAKGHMNGWITANAIYGRVTRVED